MQHRKLTILYLIVITSIALGAFAAQASFNPQINYQAKLTDSSGVAVSDGDYNVEFKLWNDATATSGANLIWTETCTSTNQISVVSGLFSHLLGSVTSLSGVDFNQELWLGVNIGGTSTPSWDGEMSPRKKLGAVPAAFEADKLDGLDSTQFLRSDANATATGQINFTGSVNLNATTTVSASSYLYFAGGTTYYIDNAGSAVLNELSAATTTLSNKLIISAGGAEISGGLTTDTLTATTSTLGNIISGAWQGTVIGAQYGGTGQNWSAVATGSIPYFSGTGILTASTSPLYIDSANLRIGIGTTTPAQKLHVHGIDSGSAGIYLNSATPSTTTYTLYNASGNLYWGGVNLSDGSSKWTTGTGDDIYRLNGNVGIGTTTPSRKLDILDVSNPQVRFSQAGSYYADFQVDALGNLTIAPSGDTLSVLDDNIEICSGGACPTYKLTGTGNLFVENLISFASDYRRGADIVFVDINTLKVGPGEVMIEGEMRKNTSAVTVNWGNIASGESETAGTDYFVYAVADATSTEFTITISKYNPYWESPGFYNSSGTSTAPSGISQYRLLGYFHNDPESNINRYSITNNDNLDGTTLAAGIPLPGMVKIPSADFAVDIYEATANVTSPSSGNASQWIAVSAYSSAPWTQIQQSDGVRGDSDDAIDACENAGKRLISSEEWLIAAQQTPDPHTSDPGDDSEGCLIWNTSSDHTSKPSSAVWAGGTEANSTCTNSGLASGNSCYSASGTYYWECTCTGTNKSASYTCESKYGIRDMVGNVWEWTSDTRDMTDFNTNTTGSWYAVRSEWFLADGSISRYALNSPSSTYLDKFGQDGVYLRCAGNAICPTQELWGGGTIAALLRGGNWANGARAGVFSLYLAYAPASSDWAIGFRCAR